MDQELQAWELKQIPTIEGAAKRLVHREKQFLTARMTAISPPTAGNCPCKASKNTYTLTQHPISKVSFGLLPLLLGPGLPISTLPSTRAEGPVRGGRDTDCPFLPPPFSRIQVH